VLERVCRRGFIGETKVVGGNSALPIDSFSNSSYVVCIAVLVALLATLVNPPEMTSRGDNEAPMTIYVDAGAESSGSGTSTDPFRTIQAGLDAAIPGARIVVRAGIYRNRNYGTDKSAGWVANIRQGGTSSSYTTLEGEPGAIIEFDGGAGVSISADYVAVENFIIRGPGESMTQEEVEEHRLEHETPGKYKGNGIVSWGPHHHIRIRNNEITWTCDSGIRVNKGDYVEILYNTVGHCTWASRSAPSALVIAEATNIDDNDGLKMRIEGNTVHHNKNRLPFYAPRGMPPGAHPPFPWYGTREAKKIIDGQGIYLTRNHDSYKHGRFLIANNLCYNNGINGISVHHTDRIRITHNTLVNNGLTTKNEGRQAAAGLAINSCNDVKVFNNIVQTRDDSDLAFPRYGDITRDKYEGNMCGRGGIGKIKTGISMVSDFEFEDEASHNYQLKASSPAISAAWKENSPPALDLRRKPRPNGEVPDVGCYEN